MNDTPLDPMNSSSISKAAASQHTSAGCGSTKSFAGFSQVDQVESPAMLQDPQSPGPQNPGAGNVIPGSLSFSEPSSAERVSGCSSNNAPLNHSKGVEYFRQLPETSRCRLAKSITSAFDYWTNYLGRSSTTKPPGCPSAMKNKETEELMEIMYSGLRETIDQSLSFDAERKAVMVHEDKVHTVQFNADIPQILSSSDAEVKVIELTRGTQWVETLSTPYDREPWYVYSAQFIANGTCLVTNNENSVKIFERSRDGKWDHEISLFDIDSSDTVWSSIEKVDYAKAFVSPDSCNVLVSAVCRRIEEPRRGPCRISTYGGKNSDGKWIELPIGETDNVSVSDVTRDGKCALVNDGDNLFIYEQTDKGLEVSSLFGNGPRAGKFSPDGTRVVSDFGFTDAKVYIRSNQGGWREEYILPNEGHRRLVWAVQFSPDGTTIALTGMHSVEIHERQGEGVRGKQTVFDFDGWHIFPEIIFSPDGTHVLITLSSGGREDDPEDAQRIIGKLSDGSWVEKASAAPKDPVAFSPDGTHVAIYTGRDQLVTLRELNDEQDLPKAAVIKHSQKVRSVQFSADGSHVVTGSDDGLVRIWGPSGKQRWIEKAVIEHDEPVHLVQFVMETTHVLACCDNRVNLYELKPRKPSPIALPE